MSLKQVSKNSQNTNSPTSHACFQPHRQTHLYTFPYISDPNLISSMPGFFCNSLFMSLTIIQIIYSKITMNEKEEGL